MVEMNFDKVLYRFPNRELSVVDVGIFYDEKKNVIDKVVLSTKGTLAVEKSGLTWTKVTPEWSSPYIYTMDACDFHQMFYYLSNRWKWTVDEVTKHKVVAAMIKNDLFEGTEADLRYALGKLYTFVFQRRVLVELSAHRDTIEKRIKKMGIKMRNGIEEIAIKLIKESPTDRCLCRYAIDLDDAQYGDSLGEIGFIVHKQQWDEYDYRECKVECPCCHQKYMLEGRFNGHSHITKVYKVD
ncbi:MAG: hypothetical protein IJW37_06685 [Lachnospiraceae bacterium]|nr:hypothetical protein [Lachnospiraceae bacterium]